MHFGSFAAWAFAAWAFATEASVRMSFSPVPRPHPSRGEKADGRGGLGTRLNSLAVCVCWEEAPGFENGLMRLERDDCLLFLCVVYNMVHTFCIFRFNYNHFYFGAQSEANLMQLLSAGVVSQPFSPASSDGVCPGSDIEFICAGNSILVSITRWEVTPDGGGDPTCIVFHNIPDEMDTCGPGGVFTSSLTGQTGLNYTSSLRAEDVSLSLNGTIVECVDGADLQIIGSTKICIVGKYGVVAYL